MRDGRDDRLGFMIINPNVANDPSWDFLDGNQLGEIFPADSFHPKLGNHQLETPKSDIISRRNHHRGPQLCIVNKEFVWV